MRTTKLARCSVAALTVAVLAACSSDETTGPELAPQITTAAYDVTQRHIFVLTQEEEASADLINEIERRGGELESEFETWGVLTVRGLDDDAVLSLSGRPDVEGVNRDISVQWVPVTGAVEGQTIELPETETDQSGAFFFAQGMQWNLSQVQADDAWLVSGQGEGQVVAVLDTGGDPLHIDLQGKYSPRSGSVLSEGSSPCGPIDEQTMFDLDFHGTFVAGMITTNGLGSASTAPDASILSIKVLNCTGSGSFGDVIAGIAAAVDNGADVINMSLGAYFSRSAPGATFLIEALQRAVSYAHHHGVLVIASAGNGGVNLDEDGDFIHVPSQLISATSVGATAPVAQMDFDNLASYTNFGITGVDHMAPGGDLTADGICGFAPIYRCDLVLSPLSTFVAGANNFYVLSGGTSFASPMVAAAAAVVASSGAPYGRLPTDYDYAAALANCIWEGSDDLGHPGPDDQYGHGRLNVIGSLGCVDGPGGS